MRACTRVLALKSMCALTDTLALEHTHAQLTHARTHTHLHTNIPLCTAYANKDFQTSVAKAQNSFEINYLKFATRFVSAKCSRNM